MGETKVLQLFEGLTADQVKEFRRRIVPALVQIRAEVVSMDPQQTTSKAKTTRGKSDAMHSNNNQRQAV